MSYVDGRQLAQWLLDSPEHIMVVDLRDQDYQDGRIRGSFHYPFNKLDIEQLLMDIKPAVTEVILHCHYSQMRAPSASNAIKEFLKSKIRENNNFVRSTDSLNTLLSGHLDRKDSFRSNENSDESMSSEASSPDLCFSDSNQRGVNIIHLKKVKFYILRGGFQAWRDEFQSNPCLYESLSGKVKPLY